MRLTRKVLSFITDEETLSSIMDDLSYRYDSLKEEKGTPAAVFRHCALFLILFIPFLLHNIFGGFAMLKNYLKTAIRHFRKQKAFSIINITGLMIGITCTILITLFIKDELSYDRFQENLNSIYRLFIRFHNPDGSVRWQGSAVHLPHGLALKEYFPEIKRCVRVIPQEFVVKLGDLIENQEITLADADFFEMFSLPLIQGHKAAVLSDISSMVISESFAKKYFGRKDPIGKTFTLISGNFRNDFIVTGVAKDPPPNSTINFNLLLNIESISLFGRADTLTSWESLSIPFKTYIELKEKASVTTIEKGYPVFARKYYAARFERERNAQFKNAAKNIDPLSFGLQRMKDIHLDPTASGSRNITPFYILGGIALIILFIAGINFVTISIGNASSRFIEVGIRKVLGAQRRQLARLHQLVTGGLKLAGALGDTLLETLVDLTHDHCLTPDEPQARLTLAHPQRQHAQPQQYRQPGQHGVARLYIERPQRHQKVQLPGQRTTEQRLIQIALADGSRGAGRRLSRPQHQTAVFQRARQRGERRPAELLLRPDVVESGGREGFEGAVFPAPP